MAASLTQEEENIKRHLINIQVNEIPSFKISRKETQLFDYPDFCAWLIHDAPQALTSLADLKRTSRVRRSADVNLKKYVLVQEANPAKNSGSPYLYVLRSELPRLIRNFRQHHIDRIEQHPRLPRLAKIVTLLRDLGLVDVIDMPTLGRITPLLDSLRRKSLSPALVRKAWMEQEAAHLSDALQTVLHADQQPYTVVSLSMAPSTVTVDLSWAIPILPRPVSLSLCLERSQLIPFTDTAPAQFLEALHQSPEDAHYRWLVRSLETYQREHALTEETLRQVSRYLPDTIFAPGATHAALSQALDKASLFEYPHQMVRLEYQGSTPCFVAFLSPRPQWKREGKAILHYQMTVDDTDLTTLLSQRTAILKSLQSYLYPYDKGRALWQNQFRPRRKRPRQPPVTANLTVDLGASTDIHQRLWHPLKARIPDLESQVALRQPTAIGDGVRYSLSAHHWRIQIRANKRALFEVHVPIRHEAMHSLDSQHGIVSGLAHHLKASLADPSHRHRLHEIQREQNHGFSLPSLNPVTAAFSIEPDELQRQWRDTLARYHHDALRHRHERERKERFQQMVAARPYHEFMYRASGARRIICFIAPTNAGKSWQARQEVLRQMRDDDLPSTTLFPLRMLALENQLWFQAQDVPTSLITGEERDLTADAQLTCQTIETFSLGIQYRTVMIDEAQLAFTPNRGPAYLRALIGAHCDTLVLTASPEARRKLQSLFGMLNEAVEFVDMERLCPLFPLDAPVGIEDVERGDLLVVFSTQALHELARRVKQLGFSVGTLYGSMPPSTRRRMMASYQAGEIDVMVSTDAIGLGCNCPVRRVLFAQTRKFDGQQFRELTAGELKQIAGRAGRYGVMEKGYFGLLDAYPQNGLTARRLAQRVTEATPERPLKTLYALPDKDVFLDSEFSLEETLKYWMKAVSANSQHPRYRYSHEQIDELNAKAQFLDQLIHSQEIDQETAVHLLFVAFDTHRLFDTYIEWIHALVHGDLIISHKEFHALPSRRDELEHMARTLAMLAQFQRIAPDLTPAEVEITERQKRVSDKIYTDLSGRYFLAGADAMAQC